MPVLINPFRFSPPPLSGPVLHFADTGVYGSSAAALSHDVPLPANAAVGDLVLIGVSTANTASVTASPAGWTGLYNSNNAQFHRWWRRVLDGSEGATVAIPLSVSQDLAALALRITGHNAGVTPPEAAASSGFNSTTQPDCPLLAPVGGVQDYLWLAPFGDNGTGALAASVDSQPTGYAYDAAHLRAAASGTAKPALIVSYKNANSASDDPSAYAVSNHGSWNATTIAVS